MLKKGDEGQGALSSAWGVFASPGGGLRNQECGFHLAFLDKMG
jgi:hypothetical protein